jgi:hypothetical protein
VLFQDFGYGDQLLVTVVRVEMSATHFAA